MEFLYFSKFSGVVLPCVVIDIILYYKEQIERVDYYVNHVMPQLSLSPPVRLYPAIQYYYDLYHGLPCSLFKLALWNYDSKYSLLNLSERDFLVEMLLSYFQSIMPETMGIVQVTTLNSVLFVTTRTSDYAVCLVKFYDKKIKRKKVKKIGQDNYKDRSVYVQVFCVGEPDPLLCGSLVQSSLFFTVRIDPDEFDDFE